MNTESAATQIVEALLGGQVVIIPTDTVYGIAADPSSERAMQTLYELKRRPRGVPVAVLVNSVEQAATLVEVDDTFKELADRHWPGALTIVAKSRSGSGLHIGAVKTVGVRLPDDELVQAISRRFGPIAASSANRHGSPAITDPVEVRREFGREVPLIIDGGILDGLASTVVDITAQSPHVVRAGTVEIDLS